MVEEIKKLTEERRAVWAELCRLRGQRKTATGRHYFETGERIGRLERHYDNLWDRLCLLTGVVR